MAICLICTSGFAIAQTRDTIVLRGRPQSVRLYGSPGGVPVIVSSGDGGWIHLAPHVASELAASGFFVVGFDAKAYLASFTSEQGSLRAVDVASDYAALAAFCLQRTRRKPVLVGISEGAGLSVLAASDARVQSSVSGVVALGLPDVNELAWRWNDAIIYVTHGVPNEPTFHAAAVVGRVSPVPLAAIHSSGDEFVPLAEVLALFHAAGEPKKLWIVKASNHRFSNNLAELDRRLLEAMSWVAETRLALAGHG